MTQDDDRSDSSWPAHDIDGDVNEQSVESAADAADPSVDELATEQAPAAAGDGAPVGTGGSIDDAAAATESAGDEPDSTATPRRRRRRRWAVPASAALVVLALAVVSAVPAVANGLGLPWAPNRPTGDPPEPTVVGRTLRGPLTGETNQPSAAGVTRALDGVLDDSAIGKLTGAVVDAASGDTVWRADPQRPRVPASTTKILTSAAALLSMSPDERIPTEVVAGDEPGTVVLVAGGDVTLSGLPADEESVYPGAAHLDELVEQVEEATDGDVRRVALDRSVYSGRTAEPSWADEDTKLYTASAVPAMLDGGRKDPTAAESERVADPAGELLDEFADRLGVSTVADDSVTAPEQARSLGKVESAPVATLLQRCLQLSDNVLADSLARQVAIHEGEEASFSGAATATRDVLRRNDFDIEGLRLFDGSGLSDRNRISASLLVEILTAAADPSEGTGKRGRELRPLLTGLPVAGGTGTLTDRYDADATRAGRGWVQAKTGTLSKVSTLAGTVLDSDGRVLVFAFMTSGTPYSTARPELDALAAKLHQCGCTSR